MSGWAFQATEHILMHITQRNAIETGFEELTQAFAKRIPQTVPFRKPFPVPFLYGWARKCGCVCGSQAQKVI